MGKDDIRMKHWLSDKDRFSSLINGALFGNKQMFPPESLHQEEKEQAIVVRETDGKEVAIDKYRDISMCADDGTKIVILACETQEEVHYAMVVRNMLYDALNYAGQVQKIRKERRKQHEKEDSGEFLSGMGKTDLLDPVLTVVLYYGDNEEGWDAHTDLYGLTGMNQRKYKGLRQYIPNYHINLIDPRKIEDLSCFNQDLQMVFGMLKYKKDKEQLKAYIEKNKQYFGHVDNETYDAIGVMLGSEKIMKRLKKKESEEQDMCKAIDDIYSDGKAEGKAEAILDLLELSGKVPEKLRKKIKEQTNLKILKKWLYTAARVSSVSEFETTLGLS